VVREAVHRTGGPPALTLITVINNRTGSGGHAGLVVNGSQRVIFDPAGSFTHPQLPERNDVLFGISDRALDYYIDFHARETFHVVQQTLVVTPEQSELALRLVQEAGPVAPAQCSLSIAGVLRQLPGFEAFRGSIFPKQAMDEFATIPGVKTERHFDDSPAGRGDLLTVPQLR